MISEVHGGRDFEERRNIRKIPLLIENVRDSYNKDLIS